MLLPNETKPELSIYYTGYQILKEIQSQEKEYDIIELYNRIKEKTSISLKVYSLSLDWLYLIEAARVSEEGRVKKCT